MEIQEIDYNYHAGYYKHRIHYPATEFATGHIFDRERTVRWNEEEVLRRNALRLEELDKFRKAEADMEGKLRSDVIRALQDEFQLCQEQAEVLEAFLWEKYHSSVGDYLQQANTYCPLVGRLNLAWDKHCMAA